MFLKLEEKDKKENNRNYIYKTLKINIMQLYLKPGDPISEIELSKIFNVSRTPIREAFIKLSEDKLIDIFPQKGSFVSHIDLKIVEEGIFMRKALEKAILLKATEGFPEKSLETLKKNFAFQKALIELNDHSQDFFNFDNQFHEIIYKGCNMERIWGIVDNMNTHYNRLRFLGTIEKIDSFKILEQHELIIKMIETKDTDGMGNLIDKHLTNIMGKLDILEKKFPNYFVK